MFDPHACEGIFDSWNIRSSAGLGGAESRQRALSPFSSSTTRIKDQLLRIFFLNMKILIRLIILRFNLITFI